MYVRPQSVHKNNFFTTCMSLVFLLTFTGLSSATASSLAAADIEAQLTYASTHTGIELVFFEGFSIVDQIESGNALATGLAAAPESLGNGIHVEASATATSAPVGSALGVGAAFGLFELLNTSSTPINVDFSLVYNWTLLGSADDPTLDSALAEIALDVLINEASLSVVSEGNSTPLNFNRGSGSEIQGTTITQVFSDFPIPAGATIVELTVAAQTEATSTAVPEPSTFILLGSGIAGLAIYQRRRRTGECTTISQGSQREKQVQARNPFMT